MPSLDPCAKGTALALPKFAPDAGFHQELKRRVREHLRGTRRSARDDPRMYVKTATILLWFAASYALLVFAASTWWQGLVLAGSLVLAAGGIGFSIQHDANHHSYSKHESVNRGLGLLLDLLGASSYIWRWKHNIAHHTYTNLGGADDDIDLTPLARLAPAQRRFRIHRWQFLYLWVLYGFLVLKWHFVYDWKKLVRGRIAGTRFPRPRGWDLLGLIGGKALFFGWALGLPALLHPWWVVLVFYTGGTFALGLLLSVVFQLAHCVEEASFEDSPSSSQQLPRSWAVHQVQSTVDFAPSNGWLTWYLGGLNFQIEHHLFPRICHVHYPELSRIVQAVCAEFGVRYATHAGLWAALASHGRWLRRMGREPDEDGAELAEADVAGV
jgi:linoleoyl-CoA desaturase